ncbi:MAG TPA: ABC transporter permease [Anaerolineae bacterium]|nr:ABC transporter permease [Anaerolineae bacterium]
MRNMWLVIKHDLGVTLRQRSFWIFTLLVPAFLLALNTYQIFEEGRAAGSDSDGYQPEVESTRLAALPAIGLVDEAHLIVDLPPEIPDDLFVHFPDPAAALAALEAGEIDQYVHIPADYLVVGNVTVYDQNFQILQNGENMGVAFRSENEWVLPQIISYNLVDDEQLFVALQNPVPGALAKSYALRAAPETAASSQELAGVVSRVMPYLYYFLLVMGSSYLMRSVVAEKENRTAEVLLLSLNPREMMAGKLLAMSALTWLQALVWVGGGILVLGRGAKALNMAEFTFPPGFLVWAVLFLILGYLLFASVMAAAGAIAPNAREGGQVTVLLIVPLMPTLMFGPAFVEDPNGILPVVLSLFPFSAPSAMVTRLAVAQVPLWQILLSLAGLALTAYLFILLAARFFRAGNLLSSESFNWRRLATGWRQVK